MTDDVCVSAQADGGQRDDELAAARVHEEAAVRGGREAPPSAAHGLHCGERLAAT